MDSQINRLHIVRLLAGFQFFESFIKEDKTILIADLRKDHELVIGEINESFISIINEL